MEVRVYIQKVKHLEYEHKNQVKKMTAEGEAKLSDAGEAHGSRETDLKRHKQSLKLELLEAELNDEASSSCPTPSSSRRSWTTACAVATPRRCRASFPRHTDARNARVAAAPRLFDPHRTG